MKSILQPTYTYEDVMDIIRQREEQLRNHMRVEAVIRVDAQGNREHLMIVRITQSPDGVTVEVS